MDTLKVRINYSPNGNVATSQMQSGEHSKMLTLKLNLEELKLLTTLASDQLFRRQFIDPKLPGYRTNPAEINLGKALVARLRLILDGDAPKRASSTTG
jgi:hypothetical protein